MQIIQVGLSHKTAPIEVREKLVISEGNMPAALRMLCPGSDPNGVLEGAILSTCNRLEVYAIVQDADQGQEHIRECLARTSGVCRTVLDPYLQVRQDEAAATHLCTVSCGLDSMILGESQIQGQVAQAHQLALCHNVTGTTINELFRTALRAGKRARTETDIARHAASISRAAVELASQIYDDLTKKSILLIGAGEMAELAGKSLVDHGVSRLVVVNRSLDRATSLAQQFGGEVLAWNLLPRALWQADIVICSTAARHAILSIDMISAAMRMRYNRYLFIIDIAVPRDVESGVGELSNVSLYDIDDLQQVVDANLAQRRREIPRVRAIIDQEVGKFVDWLQALDVVPMIVDLRDHVEGIRDAEVRWAMGKLNHLSSREQKVVLALSQRIVNKILHRPTVRLKERANGQEATRYVEALRDLFGLRVIEEACECLIWPAFSCPHCSMLSAHWPTWLTG